MGGVSVFCAAHEKQLKDDIEMSGLRPRFHFVTKRQSNVCLMNDCEL